MIGGNEMHILTQGNLAVLYGNIEKGIFEDVDPDNELYKITNDNSVSYAVASNFQKVEVDSIPDDFVQAKYLYTTENGFELNPDWQDPNAPTDDDILRSDVDYLAMMTGIDLTRGE